MIGSFIDILGLTVLGFFIHTIVRDGKIENYQDDDSSYRAVSSVAPTEVLGIPVRPISAASVYQRANHTETLTFTPGSEEKPDDELSVVIQDRPEYVLKRSRLQTYGDPFRGDIPIAPYTGDDWMVPASNPSTDMKVGAFSVMSAGYDDTNRQVEELKKRRR